MPRPIYAFTLSLFLLPASAAAQTAASADSADPVASGEPAPSAGPADPALAALHASQILEEHCAKVAAGKATESAQALSAVGPVLAEVSAAHDATGEPYLLFWRGRLNICLDREDRAQQDLSAFISAVSDDPAYAPQAREGNKLLRRLIRTNATKPTAFHPGAIVAGAGLLAGSGVLAGLSAWQWQIAGELHSEYVKGERAWTETDSIGEEGDAAQIRAGVFVGLAVGAAVGGVASMVLSGVVPKTSTSSTAGSLMPLADGGLALSLQGRW